MASRTELHEAIKQLHQDMDDLVQLAKDSDKAMKAVQAKVDAEEDFSAEMNELNGIHANFVAAAKSLHEKSDLPTPEEAAAAKPEATAAANTGIEWNDDKSQVRDLPSGDWRNPTDDEAKNKPA